jgi:glutaredoxin-related protein
MHEELKSMTNHRTVPNVWVNQQFVGGNDDTYDKYEAGELEKMFKEK